MHRIGLLSQYKPILFTTGWEFLRGLVRHPNQEILNYAYLGSNDHQIPIDWIKSRDFKILYAQNNCKLRLCMLKICKIKKCKVNFKSILGRTCNWASGFFWVCTRASFASTTASCSIKSLKRAE